MGLGGIKLEVQCLADLQVVRRAQVRLDGKLGDRNIRFGIAQDERRPRAVVEAALRIDVDLVALPTEQGGGNRPCRDIR